MIRVSENVCPQSTNAELEPGLLSKSSSSAPPRARMTIDEYDVSLSVLASDIEGQGTVGVCRLIQVCLFWLEDISSNTS